MIKKVIHRYTEGFRPRKEFPRGITGFFRWVEEILATTPPGLVRLMKIQPVFALVSSFFVLFLFEKGFEKAPLIIALCLFAAFYITSKLYFIKEPQGIFTVLLDTALIFALSSMLLFVTPFYLESMSIPSRNMLFTPLILALAVVASWYELYLKIIAPHPLRSSLFYALTFFCVLNFLLPVIFGVRNIWSLMIAGKRAHGARVRVSQGRVPEKRQKHGGILRGHSPVPGVSLDREEFHPPRAAQADQGNGLQSHRGIPARGRLFIRPA